jgi:aldose 1-epimerase
MVGERIEEGLAGLTLESDALGGIEATFVPEAGMVGCSLRHRGEELLGQRGGLRKYVDTGSTMGIPFLHPWANRLGESSFELAGREVNLDLDGLHVKRDAGGLPMHGLLGAARRWQVDRHAEVEGGELLAASFDFAAFPQLLVAFPFPHRVELVVTLGGATLTIATTVHATGDTPVPISFGFHPYLCLPGVERADWVLEAPVSERLELDERMLPTGRLEPIEIEPGRLGDRHFDDPYLAPANGKPLALEGSGRRIELQLGFGYPFTQIYAPTDTDAVAIEPMTAPTNALVTGADLRMLDPGDSFTASFSISLH